MERKLRKYFKHNFIICLKKQFSRIGYLEREIKKDCIPMLDTGENPEAPQPREMYDLEVIFSYLLFIM